MNMYCRTCGNMINDNAEVCVKCGCKPLIGKAYCQNCGTKTTYQQIICTKCGISLKSSLTTEQKKKVIKNKGLKFIGIVSSVISILFFVAVIINLGYGITTLDQYGYEEIEHLGAAIRCGILGTAFLLLGNSLKRKTKKTK